MRKYDIIDMRCNMKKKTVKIFAWIALICMLAGVIAFILSPILNFSY
jgi:hypothetical protein